MKTKKRGILGRLSRSNRENKKSIEVIKNPTTNSLPTVKLEEDHPTCSQGDSPMGPTLSGISEDLQSSISSDSNVTSASDLMKCLNSLRIQEASVTNSNSTPSAASIPRLAPPPKSQSESNIAPVMCQTWPRLESSTSNKTALARVSIAENVQKSKVKENGKKVETNWVAFASDVSVENEKFRSTSREGNSVSFHSVSSPLASEIEVKKEESPFAKEEIVSSMNHEESQTVKKSSDTVEESSSVVVETPPVEALKSAFQNHWRDSDEDSEPLEVKLPSEVNPFAEPSLLKNKSSETLQTKSPRAVNFDLVLQKYGSPLLELVETVDACFAGNKLSEYRVTGEVKFKLSGGQHFSLSDDSTRELSQTVVDCLEVCWLVLRLKCVAHHVYLKKIMVKKTLMEDQLESSPSLNRMSSLTMIEARKGILESRLMYWNLAKCFQEALVNNSVTLLKYPVQTNQSCGPPLLIQISWQKPKRSGNPVLVDVVILPNRNLTTSLYGVTVCLKGFGDNKFHPKEALACPEAKWNSKDCSFEWSIPIINPGDARRHLKVKVTGEKDEIVECDLKAYVKFVMPHSTLSSTLLLGWIQRRYGTDSDPLFGDEETMTSSPTKAIMTSNNSNLIFCDKMCLAGEYQANTDY